VLLNKIINFLSLYFLYDRTNLIHGIIENWKHINGVYYAQTKLYSYMKLSLYRKG